MMRISVKNAEHHAALMKLTGTAHNRWIELSREIQFGCWSRCGKSCCLVLICCLLLLYIARVSRVSVCMWITVLSRKQIIRISRDLWPAMVRWFRFYAWLVAKVHGLINRQRPPPAGNPDISPPYPPFCRCSLSRCVVATGRPTT